MSQHMIYILHAVDIKINNISKMKGLPLLPPYLLQNVWLTHRGLSNFHSIFQIYFVNGKYRMLIYISMKSVPYDSVYQ